MNTYSKPVESNQGCVYQGENAAQFKSICYVLKRKVTCKIRVRIIEQSKKLKHREKMHNKENCSLLFIYE